MSLDNTFKHEGILSSDSGITFSPAQYIELHLVLILTTRQMY
jgi:hypothetical protein